MTNNALIMKNHAITIQNHAITCKPHNNHEKTPILLVALYRGTLNKCGSGENVNKTEIGCMCNSRGLHPSTDGCDFVFHLFPVRGCNFQLFYFIFVLFSFLLTIATRSVWPHFRGSRAGRPARPPRQSGHIIACSLPLSMMQKCRFWCSAELERQVDGHPSHEKQCNNYAKPCDSHARIMKNQK